MISTVFRNFFSEDENHLFNFDPQSDDFFGDESINNFDSDDFFKNESVDKPTDVSEEEEQDQGKKNEELKPYVYQYESVSQRINDIGMKKERVYDSKKGSQFLTKRKKGNKVMNVLKKKNLEGKEDLKTTFENVKDEKEFENEWKEVKGFKMNELNKWDDMDMDYKMLM